MKIERNKKSDKNGYNNFKIVVDKSELIKLYEKINDLYNENIFDIEDIKKSEKELFVFSYDKKDFILNDFEFISIIDNNFIDNGDEIQEFDVNDVI